MAKLSGRQAGWIDACRYVRGGKQARRAIRRKLTKSYVSGAAWWAEYREGWAKGVEIAVGRIADGSMPRLVNPHKLANLLDRVDAETLARQVA